MLETRSRATAYVSVSVRSAEGARHFTDFDSSSGVPPDDYTHFHLSATMTSSTQTLTGDGDVQRIQNAAASANRRDEGAQDAAVPANDRGEPEGGHENCKSDGLAMNGDKEKFEGE